MTKFARMVAFSRVNEQGFALLTIETEAAQRFTFGLSHTALRLLNAMSAAALTPQIMADNPSQPKGCA